VTGGRLGGERDDGRPADLGADVDGVEAPDVDTPSEQPGGPGEPPVETAPGEQEDG
jgi:hypothetical protein